jgi:ubiquinone/menaquinone biosynthesis C-methylase UbiE
MLSVQPEVHVAPFDAIADRYDEIFTSSRIGQAQRASVWKELEKAFHPGDRVLEIGCGTGVDACFLAERGVTVVACDNSSRMIEVAARRVADARKHSFVQPQVLAAEEIGNLEGDGSFDGAFSNFGALNCVEDLGTLARNLGRLLRPRATALLCLMGPCCLWEVGWYLAQGDPRKAFRRLRRGGVTAQLADAPPVHVHYPTVQTLKRTFAPEFRLKSFKGIGVTVPPSYVEPWVRRFPGVLQVGVRVDSMLGRCPGIRVLADHILLKFERDAL